VDRISIRVDVHKQRIIVGGEFLFAKAHRLKYGRQYHFNPRKCPLDLKEK